MRNREVLHRVKGKKNVFLAIYGSYADIFPWNCLLRHVTEGKIEGKIKVMGRRVRRSKQLLDDLNNTIGYCKLKPEGKRPLGRPRRRWEDNIKMDLQEMAGGCGDWMELAQDRDRWRALVSTVMNLRVP